MRHFFDTFFHPVFHISLSSLLESRLAANPVVLLFLISYRLGHHMMPTFTRAAPPPADPLGPKEIIDPDTTPAKRQRAEPTTPTRSTTLHKRFLDEVSMSTSPQPAPAHTLSPTKGLAGRLTPTKGRDSPTKEKLEVGTMGFYFSCELPMSKISPKKGKGGTPVRKEDELQKREMNGDSTPKKETPARALFNTAVLRSPVRKVDAGGVRAGTLKKSTPTRAVFGTPVRNATTPDKTKCFEKKDWTPQSPSRPPFGSPLRRVATPDARNSPKSSPTRSIKTTVGETPKKRTPARVQIETPLRNVTTPKDAAKERTSATKPTKVVSWFDKGRVPTPGGSCGPGKDVEKEETVVVVSDAPAAPSSTGSPRPVLNTTVTADPKPARGSSFDIGDLMAGLKSHASSTASVTRSSNNDISEPPTPLRKAAEKLGDVQVIVRSNCELENLIHLTPGTNGIDSPKDASEEHCTFMPFHIKEQTLQYQPLLFPKPAPGPEVKEEDSTVITATRHAGCHDFSARSSDSPKANTSTRPGTTPKVFQAMQQDMHTLTRSLSNSLGFGVEFSGKENTFELPAMANSLLESDQQSLLNSQPRPPTRRTKSNVSNKSNSTTSSIGTVRASTFVDRRDVPGIPECIKPAPSHWPYACKTSGQTRRERMAAEKEKDLAEWQAEVRAQEQQKLMGRKTTTAESITPHKDTSSAMASRAKAPARTPRSKPSTPAKSKATGSGIPRSARKSVFDSPSTKNLLATRKPVVASRRPGAFTPRKPLSTPRPVFASAKDIANTVALWNTKDKKNGTTSPTKPKTTKSTTPKVSPAKPTHLVPPRAISTLNLTPKRPAPNPPSAPTTPRNPAVQRLRAPAPRTPATQRALDPNAFRTPSKAIQGSLDRAIDEKIAEDARRGRVGLRLYGGDGTEL
jgi:hypothetical protein